MAWYDFLKPVGRFVRKAAGYVEKYVTEENIQQALSLALIAASKFDTTEERREWVIKTLVARGVPESIARLALELAVQLIKKQAPSVSA